MQRVATWIRSIRLLALYPEIPKTIWRPIGDEKRSTIAILTQRWFERSPEGHPHQFRPATSFDRPPVSTGHQFRPATSFDRSEQRIGDDEARDS
jgi:hypothetical protein